MLMTKASERAAPFTALLSLASLVAAGPARAAIPAIEGGESRPGLFSFGYMSAFDYILLAVALIVGVVTGLLYYRSTLLDAVKKMQKPSKVKLRGVGLGLAAFALVLLLSPALPVG